MWTTHAQSARWDERVKEEHMKPNEKFANMQNRPTDTMPQNESMLVTGCRRALTNGKPKKPMEHIRMLCLARGASGIYNLGRAFRRMSHNGDHLTLEGFIGGLKDVGMECSVEESAEIFKAFDHKGDGFLDMTEFLLQLRLLSVMREAIIDRCFHKSDKDGDNFVSIEELRRTYSVQHHPLYLNGDEDRDTIMKRFLATFEEGENPKAEITHEEFLNYYAGISASILENGYFDLLLREEYNL